ncbi:translocator protein-like [Apostichopus japonicus]|uniref:translocator protein-like n=1 Tax=Stichopus japonicus TaxID=307972 RepID=UPI003AB27491
MPDYNVTEYLRIAAAVVLPHIGGLYGATITKDQIKGWYKTLNKPPWTPPNWVFGPMWTSLYTAMGYASYLAWKDGGGFKNAMLPLGSYAVGLGLNWMWTPVFFGRHKLGPSVAIILSCLGMTIGTAYLYYPINETACFLNFPLIAWLTLASSVNIYVWLNNKEKGNGDS